MISSLPLRTLTLALLVSTALSVQATRLLTTDEASSIENATCPVKTWGQEAGSARTYGLASTCGNSKPFVLGRDVGYDKSRIGGVTYLGSAQNWVPIGAKFSNSVGKINPGAKRGLGLDAARRVGGGGKFAGIGSVGLVPLELSSNVTSHFDLVSQRDGEPTPASGLLNTSVVEAPIPMALLFEESQADDDDRLARQGGTVRTVGARWWLVSDEFGVDLTASREVGAGGPTMWSIGVGWYGMSR